MASKLYTVDQAAERMNTTTRFVRRRHAYEAAKRARGDPPDRSATEGAAA
jgi:hypothetical protein